MPETGVPVAALRSVSRYSTVIGRLQSDLGCAVEAQNRNSPSLARSKRGNRRCPRHCHRRYRSIRWTGQSVKPSGRLALIRPRRAGAVPRSRSGCRGEMARLRRSGDTMLLRGCGLHRHIGCGAACRGWRPSQRFCQRAGRFSRAPRSPRGILGVHRLEIVRSTAARSCGMPPASAGAGRTAGATPRRRQQQVLLDPHVGGFARSSRGSRRDRVERVLGEDDLTGGHSASATEAARSRSTSDATGANTPSRISGYRRRRRRKISCRRCQFEPAAQATRGPRPQPAEIEELAKRSWKRAERSTRGAMLGNARAIGEVFMPRRRRPRSARRGLPDGIPQRFDHFEIEMAPGAASRTSRRDAGSFRPRSAACDAPCRPTAGAAQSSMRRNRSALAMTETLLALIAALASIGPSVNPVHGYSTPAAIGTPTVL